METQAPEGTIDSWEANAQHWDTTMGSEGNKYWQLLELPSLKRLAPVAPGCKALDLATGNGLVARWLASEGASVVATDGSRNMLDLAARRTNPDLGESITYQSLDMSRASEFESLIASESAVSCPDCRGWEVSGDHPDAHQGRRFRCRGDEHGHHGR